MGYTNSPSSTSDNLKLSYSQIYNNSTPAISISPNNSVGVGTDNPSSSYRMQVNGNLRVNTTTYTSDKKYKNNILPIENAISKINNIEGVKYNWNTELFPKMNFDRKIHFGVLAQDIEKVYPNLVFTDEWGNKAVNYTELIPVIIEATKEQQSEIEILKKEIIELKKIINELK